MYIIIVWKNKEQLNWKYFNQQVKKIFISGLITDLDLHDSLLRFLALCLGTFI